MINPNDKATVAVVDDDYDVRESLKWLLESIDLRVMTYSCAQDFLNSDRTEQSDCILLDACMPDMHGLQLHRILLQRGLDIPVILMTGHGDVRMAVTALKQGVFDFIEKPCNDQLLLDCVQNALNQEQSRRSTSLNYQNISEHFTNLTSREREVMVRIVQGMPNQAIAEIMQVSRKTVEVHRARVMEKMHARTFSDLIQMAIAIGLLDEYTNAESHSDLHG